MIKFSLCLIALLSATLSQALEIHPELGNVTNTTIDLIASNNGSQLFIERFYNSSASQSGWFGRGFGSQFETFLVKEADGSLSVHEYGQSPGRVFSPASGRSSDEAMVKLILEKKKIPANAIEIYRKKLLENRPSRIEAAREVGIVGKASEGDQFVSRDYDGETITFRKDRFIRIARDGKTQIFSQDGRLVELRDPRKNQTVTLTYDDKGRTVKLNDNFSNQINIQWGLDDHISVLQSGKDATTASFSFKDGYLSKVVNQNKETFTYEFSNNNLVKITYPDKKVLAIDYNPKTREPVKVRYPDGRKEEYLTTVKDDGKSRTRTITLRKFLPGGRADEVLKWSYTHVTNEQGERRLVTRTFDDGVAPETTTYRDCCYPQPQKIVMGDSSVTFEYDGQNRLIKKSYSSGRTLLISYDGKGLISSINVDGVPYRFRHDPKSTELVEIQGPDYKAKLNREKGLLKTVSYSVSGDNKVHEAVYSYDKKQRITGIAIDKKVVVRYDYTKAGQTFEYAKQNESEKLLGQVDKMMTDAMILREVNYTF